jgi:GTP:adenosylcobinamide-phosphate guanylyltransferase
MALDFLDESKFKTFVTKLIYDGPLPKQSNYHGTFENAAQAREQRDLIIKNLVNYYIRRCIRDYTDLIENEPSFVVIDRKSPGLPEWVQSVFDKGKKVYEFDESKVSEKLRNDIIIVSKYLYNIAGKYVDDIIDDAEKNNTKPVFSNDYLRTIAKISSFEYVLKVAKTEQMNTAINKIKSVPQPQQIPRLGRGEVSA